VKIGQYGVGTQLTNGFATMAYAMLVGIGLVYPIVVILVYLLLVPLVIFFALPLIVISCFVSLAVTGRALDLSALISLPMLRGIVVTNAIVLHKPELHKIEVGPNIITGSVVSLQVTALPIAVIAVGIWIAYSVGGGLYGVTLAVAAMLSMPGIVVAVGSYGRITHNAGGIVECPGTSPMGTNSSATTTAAMYKGTVITGVLAALIFAYVTSPVTIAPPAQHCTWPGGP
jgi:hypothetical protein